MTQERARSAPGPSLLDEFAEGKRITDLELGLQEALETAALAGLICWRTVLMVIRELERGVWAVENPDHPWACPPSSWEPRGAEEEQVRRLIRHPAGGLHTTYRRQAITDPPDPPPNSDRGGQTPAEPPERGG